MRLFLLFAVLSLASTSYSQADCLSNIPTPVNIPIQNVTLPNGLLLRGAALSIGTPPQSLAFGLSLQWQNTFVYDNFSRCDNPVQSESEIQCSAIHGGFFDGNSSSTWKRARNMTAAGGALDLNQGNGVIEDNLWGTDSFHINSSLVLEDFPIGIARTTSLYTEVGLARNSTLVDALYAKGAIGSKSWGLSMGWQGTDPLHQADGSLVLGGYDVARTNGTNSTYPISGDTARGDCPGGLVVTIRDIVLNQKNGSSPSILPSSAGSVLQACIDPAFSVLQLPSDIFESFLNKIYSPAVAGTYSDGRARSTGVNFWGMLFPLEDVYDGDMTITISPGLDIHIPNHQLVSPDYHFNAEGSLTEPNSTVRELLFNSLQEANADDMPVLGRPFLASSYLFVDNDRQEFTLWPGNPTATEEEIISVGTTTTCIPNIGTATPPAASPTPGSKDSATDKSISNGAVAGIVIGSLAGLTILSFILVRYLRAASSSRTTPVSNPEKSDDQLPPYLAFKAEMPTDRQPPQEMPVERDPGYAVQPYEMAVDPHEMSAEPATSLLEQWRWGRRNSRSRRGETQQRAEMP